MFPSRPTVRDSNVIILKVNPKIFFACSVRGGRDNLETSQKVVSILRNYGELFGEFNIDPSLEEKEQKAKTSDQQIYKADVRLIEKADLFVAEVSAPSLGVGYELGVAEAKEKRILCLYNLASPNKLSVMINGNENITLIKYKNLEELKNSLRDYFSHNWPKRLV